MAGPANSTGAARRRKPPAPAAAGAVARAPRSTAVAAATNGVDHADPRAAAKEALNESASSMLVYTAVSIAVAAIFVFLALNAPRVPPGALRAVVIDAGSTGTRAQLFTFAREPQLTLLATEMHSVPAPLAALAVAEPGPAAKTAADNLFRPLLDQLRAAVPSPKKRATVPVLLYATAGLRLLGSGPAELALQRSREALAKSGFLFRDEWARILDERDEGVHAWTTVNYLLGNFNASSGAPDEDDLSGTEERFVGVMDLGGASVQVVFRSDEEPDKPPKLTDAERLAGRAQPVAPDVVHAHFFNRSYRVLTKSHLGHGLFDFTKKLYMLFDTEGVLEKGNPCYRHGKTFPRKSLVLGLPGSEESRVVQIEGDGDFGRCVSSIDNILSAYDIPADSALKAARNTEFYAFAYFYDRTVGLGLPEVPTKAELVDLGNKLCGPATSDAETQGIGATDEACAEFSYIYALLSRVSDNFDPSTGVKFRFVQYIKGHMLGWSLGTVLDQLPTVARLQLETQTP